MRLRVALPLACALTLVGLQAFSADAGAHRIFVTSNAPGAVVAIDSQTNTVVGSPTDLGAEAVLIGIAITPDGARAYVVDRETDDLSVIDTRTGQLLGPRIGVLEDPKEIAIAPDGKIAYVIHEILGERTVSAIDTRTNQAVGPVSSSGGFPRALVVAPDGRTLYVLRDFEVSVIDTRTNQETLAIDLQGGSALAITPDGSRIYATDTNGDVRAIDTGTNQIVGSPIPLGGGSTEIAMSPDGHAIYLSIPEMGTVQAIDTRTNQVVGQPIPVGGRPAGIVVSPDGKAVYVANEDTSSVQTIDARTNEVVGTPIPVGGEPKRLAIVPNQPPVASFSHLVARPGVPVSFDARASRDPDGAIASFNWSFGRAPALAAGPTVRHTFARPGTYTASLTLTDNEGCSTTQIFTGETAHCNGSGVASKTIRVKVAYPGVRVRCPAKMKPRRCGFALQVVTKARNGKPKSQVAKASAKRGKSAIVSLKPTARYAKQLARAKVVLAKVTLKIGDSRRTTYRKLKIVR